MVESFMATEQTEFEPIDSTLAKLRAIPGINSNLAERRAARAQMEREYKSGLAMVREVARLTQIEVAERMGIAQGSVSRLESRDDLLLSSLRSYFRAIGVDATLLLKFGAETRTVALDDLVGA